MGQIGLIIMKKINKKMKAIIYSNHKIIGTSELSVIDESMGVIAGKFTPTGNYTEIRNTIWEFHESNSKNKFDKLEELRLNAKLENNVFLFPIGGFLITDIKELQSEDIEFEAPGNFRHVIEDNFINNPPKERIFEPWELISIDQKIAYEDELSKEISDNKRNRIFKLFNRKKHRLYDYEFCAIAKSNSDDVLFAINKQGASKFDYVVIHLTWKGKLEEDDKYPVSEFFETFDHFLNYRMYPDKTEWEL